MQLIVSQDRNYLAVGCVNGIYVGLRANSCESSELLAGSVTNSLCVAFRRVLQLINPTSLAALPKFNKLLVHCETALFSYPLDVVIRVSHGNASPQLLVDSAERLAQKDGNISFFKAGYAGGRTLGKQSSHIICLFVSHPKKLFTQRRVSCILHCIH
jgi:RHO1 GDP-GTP exchange protein 1/2